MTIKKVELIKLSPYFVFFIALTWFVRNNIFFWDTVQLGARHALFYYENNFSSLLLPDNIDSGHIPVFGMYIALCWKLFGKSLLVSHFAMLPFLIGIVFQAYRLIKQYISPEYVFMALTLFLADPTLLGQAVLVTPDILLVFFFLMGLNSILTRKVLFVSIATVCLAFISMRGMMVAFSILLFDCIFTIKYKSFKVAFTQLFRKSFVYLPSLLIFLAFNIYHYKIKGWIGYHEDSPWAECFERVDFIGVIYNTGLLGWRILDYGRVFVWIVFLWAFIKVFRVQFKDKKIIQLYVLYAILLINLSISFVLYKNLSGYRYILPLYLVFTLITSYFIFEKIQSEKVKKISFTIILIGLLSGNLWIYPPKIAQGWDATLAHLPYYGLRDKMNEYLEENEIAYEELASVFPNKSERKYMELNGSMIKHKKLDLAINKYVLYSNIYNDFTDEQIDQLEVDFVKVKEFKKMRVFIRLYKKKILE